MAQRNLKNLFASRDLKVGHAIFEFNSPGLGQILSAAGVDFAFLDMEHSGFSISDVKQSVGSLRTGDIPTLVRPPSNSYDHISRALDVGADGLILPMVSSKKEVCQIIECMKYPPQGKRGVALRIAHDRYKIEDTARVLSKANRRTVLAVLVETEEAIKNIDEIASVGEVDCLWIGHFDLSCSLGVNGQFDHPDFVKSVDKVRTAAKKYNKSLGQLVDKPETGIEFFKKGFDVICYSGDLWVYQDALARGIDQIKATCDEVGSAQRKVKK